MGLLQSILNGFRQTIDPEQEELIRTQLHNYSTAKSQLTSHYVSHSEMAVFHSSWNTAYNTVKSIRVPRKHELYGASKEFISSYQNLSAAIEECNGQFVEREKIAHAGLLSDIDGKALDDQQKTAVIVDEDRNLVIAGAGSGKTLTIAGKVKYLCDVKGILPEDILLIAFTRKSAEEMTDRIAHKLQLPVQATTFHKLGLDIITAAREKRPDVLDDLTDFVRNYFEERVVNDPKAVKNLIEYFAYYLKIPADLDKFDSLGDAYSYEKGADFETIRGKYDRAKYIEQASEGKRASRRTLQNEQVKSLEEVQIANFLFLNGVKYEYERLYPFESDDPSRKAYRPDFYLPDYDLYLEHFGINREGKLPWLSPVEEQKYLDSMKWKRAFHAQNGTTLLETYSYYSSEGRLTSELEKALKAHGVKFREVDFEDIFNSIYAKESDKYFAEFIGLCSTFITLFKSAGYKTDDLWKLEVTAQNRFLYDRTRLFLEIIYPILSSYGDYLSHNNAIDFADMINQAAELVSGGHKVHPYKWVIVDEYQDISVARYKLVHAILNQTGAKLLCVGDDWQSIYRFAGSDISLFTPFGRYFGTAAIMRLEQTYRNSQQLIDEAGAFVMKNSQQYKKNLRSSKSLDYPITFMCYEDNPFSVLKRTLDKIIHDAGQQSSILLLGRTNYDFEIIRESGLFTIKRSGEIAYMPSPSTPISFLTVHRSKGLEADNVVLLNFQNSTLGFPNKIADDPVLSLVLTDNDEFPYAEERRLLYVALTRTRNRVFVLADENKPSEFMTEFRPSKSVFILSSSSQNGKSQVLCPRCKTGHLMVRKSESNNKYFVGCSNFPQCDYTVRDTAVMTDTRVCPECGGFLVKRRGKWGTFYGCTNYPTCNYTEQQHAKGH